MSSRVRRLSESSLEHVVVACDTDLVALPIRYDSSDGERASPSWLRLTGVLLVQHNKGPDSMNNLLDALVVSKSHLLLLPLPGLVDYVLHVRPVPQIDMNFHRML